MHRNSYFYTKPTTMKFTLTLLLSLFLLSFSLHAQRQYIVVKFNGDTLRCDEVVAGGKTMTLKTKGQDKIKIPAAEVKYYIEPFKMMFTQKGKPNELRDSTRKMFVPEDGKINTVFMENDSVYLTETTKTVDNHDYHDYYIYRKNDNVLVVQIKEDKTAIDVLAKYFGGSCAKFDAEIEAARPAFQKRIFPVVEWTNLFRNYKRWCPQH